MPRPSGWIDAYDIGALIGKQHGCEGTRDVLTEVDDAHAGQGE